MRYSLILTLLAFILLVLNFSQARAQAGDPLAEAKRLNSRCVQLQNAGKYDDALEPCQRALTIREKALGKEHPDVAQSLGNLGSLYDAKGDYERAEQLHQRALMIREKVLGPEHLSVATSLNNLAELYRQRSEYARAEPLLQRALTIYEKTLGSDHPDVTIPMNNLALLYSAKGEYAKAEVLYQRALTISEKAFGPEHLNLATLLSNISALHHTEGDYAKAEPLLQRAISIYEKALGTDHPQVATSLNNLALLYQKKGDYAKSEINHKRALLIYEKALGPDHPLVATSLNNLAEMYRQKGDYATAESLLGRALAIEQKTLGGDHPNVATSMNNLALLYREKGEYAKAELLYQQALAIYEKTLGSEHSLVATSLYNLAGLYREKGDHDSAKTFYSRALKIFEKAVGSEHPDVATALNSLAEMYRENGEYARAEPLYRRALAIHEKALGSEHLNVAIALNNLTALYEGKEDYPRAIEFEARAQEIRESNINAILATGSEKQKQFYLDTVLGDTYASVSLHAHAAPANAQAARLALTTILRRKGRALDAMTDQIAALRRRATPDDVKLLDGLKAAQTQLANLQLSNDARLPPAERRQRVTEFEAEIEKLQNDIGRRNAEFRVRTQPVTLDTVRGAIPKDAALVEIFAYQPFNAKAKPTEENFEKARYVAYVLKPESDAPQFVDLGEAASIDTDLKLWREALLDSKREDVRSLGRKVDERVMRPVRKLLSTTKHVFISPDGALNLIPFAALVDENDKYLLETYSLNYLTSGRDLLRLKVTSEPRSGPYVFANPTYNLTGERIAACERRNYARELSLDTESTTSKREIVSRGIDFTKVCYPPLKGTAEEAARIGAIMPGATVLTEKSATEAALKSVNTPPILHIATHGFFLADQPQTAPKARQFERVEVSGNSSRPHAENPLLRSGLIMAGANQKSSGTGEDGVLTAAEAAGLNLWGTKLIVLSACETGLGEVVNGAGVYGLRRALVLAGSETQVMSLWQVDDAATRDLMSDYYTRLKRNEGRTEAMRQAQLKMLQSKAQDRAHPFYWAAFISSGDWRSMDKTNQ